MHKINLYGFFIVFSSGFVEQTAGFSEFTNAESWVVLSSIEKQIKEKIERIGVPLKDWDIQINYGIKTGFNDAFIIDGAKRDELIQEDPKSAEIIRPILRGRDIKRYAYHFADLWLINTHNGVKEKGIKPINIDDYPAVKRHLDKYYVQLDKRLDKGETLYNLRNCAYMDDFSKQKIVWKRVGSLIRFAYDEAGHLALDSTCFATGESIKFLTVILNSKMGKYLLKDSPKTGTGDLIVSVQAVEPILIPHINITQQFLFENLFNLLFSSESDDRNGIEEKLNRIIYELYQLDSYEIEFIELQ